MLKAVKALNISDVVLGQYEGDPDGTTSDSKLSYLDDPTVPKGKLSHLLRFSMLSNIRLCLNT